VRSFERRSRHQFRADVDDTLTILELLRDRFGAKTYVAGFSFGTALAVCAAARRPDLVLALVAVGTDIDGVAAGNAAYDFALAKAKAQSNRRATHQLKSIGRPPHLSSKQFSTRVRWASNFGGVTTNQTYSSLARELLVSLLRSPDYSATDVIATLRRIGSTQAALLWELPTLELVRIVPRLNVPIVMVQGRLDQVAPGDAAERYAAELDGPVKQLVWFDSSAHAPHLEEPERFRKVLMRVLAGDFTNT
jgi:pimeloyl-ACP methyl ester carboxylesterase